MRNKLVGLCLFALCALASFAQQTMNNQSINGLIKAGMSDDNIVTTINASPGSYDTSADALIALIKSGASNKVIAAILAKSTGGPSANATNSAAPSDQSPAVHEPDQMGKIFLLDPAGQALEELPREPWKRRDKPGFGSMKVLDIVAGPRSSLRISSKDKVVFLFKPFPDQQNSNVLERIQLYRFDVGNDERSSLVETVKGQTHQGNLQQIPLEAVKYGTSSYALSPSGSHLDSGEYWISVPWAASYNDPLITFGVD
jgi:hypothetical protein